MRTEQETLLDRMRAKGLRITHQRQILAELLEEADEHLDAEAVYERAHSRDSQIHRATVYRTLNTLKKMGLVDELDLMHVAGERHFYEIRPSVFHIHLVCMKCGDVSEPSGGIWDEIKSRVQKETGFRPEVVRLEMGGACRDCQTRENPRPS
ncbi:MAG: transcriptional repressor [Acidobacteriota bacterium]|nr:transcriptional repressor [Acidobacteriota bacterium]MDH3784795.1 transcriptional repressor [Acidobacteriota bacterium]